MVEPRDPKLQRQVEMRLRQRLEDYAADLRSETAGGDAGGGSSFLTGGAVVASWVLLLEQHCARVLADLIAFQAEADDEDARAWLAGRFDDHVETAVGRTVQKLQALRPGGSSGDAVRRFANLGRAITARAREDLRTAGAAPRDSAEPATPEASEWDDRLPLRRRGAFDRELPRLLAAALAQKEPLALVMVDLDHFKRVNDEHGHPAGDEVLLSAAQRIIKRLGKKGRAYRYGGEEITLLLPTYSAEEALGLAERIRKDLADEPMGSKRLVVTASFGVAAAPDHAGAAAELLERADRALYAAKHGGRNCCRIGDEPASGAGDAVGAPTRDGG